MRAPRHFFNVDGADSEWQERVWFRFFAEGLKDMDSLEMEPVSTDSSGLTDCIYYPPIWNSFFIDGTQPNLAIARLRSRCSPPGLGSSSGPIRSHL